MIDSGYIDFEWDPHKAELNAGKHAVTFEEAAESFYDPYARIIDDPDHSDNEERFILIGMSMSARVLTVSHFVRGGRTDCPHHLGAEIDEERGMPVLEVPEMREEYDFSDSRPNPYIERLRKPVTMNLDIANIDYFKAESARTGVPYQVIINMYLTECREQGKHLAFA